MLIFQIKYLLHQVKKKITHALKEYITNIFSKDIMSVKHLSILTNLSWDAIQEILEEFVDKAIDQRIKDLISSGYKPKRLAVDEFAIEKGHHYATVVIDLNLGEILWIGLGKRIVDFRNFFKEYKPSFYSEIEAFAMDMNAVYNAVVKEFNPKIDIVYDKFHLLKKYNHEVLDSIRISTHKEIKNRLENKKTRI